MRKSTTARIEDTLDIVAEKIIDLEHTAKQLEQLKRDISSEITRFENLSMKVDTSTLKVENKQFVEKISAINNHYLLEVDKKNKVHRPLHYLILILLTMLLASCITIVFLREEKSDLKNRVEWYMQQETKKGNK